MTGVLERGIRKSSKREGVLESRIHRAQEKEGVLESRIHKASEKEGVLEKEIVGPRPSRRQKVSAFFARREARSDEKREAKLAKLQTKLEKEKRKTATFREKFSREREISEAREERKKIRAERKRLAKERFARFFGEKKRPQLKKAPREQMLRGSSPRPVTIPRERAAQTRKQREVHESREDDGFDFSRDVIGF